VRRLLRVLLSITQSRNWPILFSMRQHIQWISSGLSADCAQAFSVVLRPGLLLRGSRDGVVTCTIIGDLFIANR
jgi:hypothetical protein